jgi:hypothetical protein
MPPSPLKPTYRDYSRVKLPFPPSTTTLDSSSTSSSVKDVTHIHNPTFPKPNINPNLAFDPYLPVGVMHPECPSDEETRAQALANLKVVKAVVNNLRNLKNDKLAMFETLKASLGIKSTQQAPSTKPTTQITFAPQTKPALQPKHVSENYICKSIRSHT